MRVHVLFMMLIFLPLGVAVHPPTASAREDTLAHAARMLQNAYSAPDRLQALSAAIRAYEAALATLRTSQRYTSRRTQEIRQSLSAQRRDIAALLGVLQEMGKPDAPIPLLHPQGPLGMVRAGMIATDLTPALQGKATQLQDTMEELRALDTRQSYIDTQLKNGLSEVQSARTELSKAITNRTRPPQRFAHDPIHIALLTANATSLSEFIAQLNQIVTDDTDNNSNKWGTGPEIGVLPLPAHGELLREAGQADAAGIVRPGILLKVSDQALITSPTAATVRYKGPLLDMGHVVILEITPDALIILAGLEQIYIQAGQILAPGAPIGMMAKTRETQQARILSPHARTTQDIAQQTLYIETRHDNIPQDPATWFLIKQDG